jgi:putative DNA primase/helicase
MAKKPPKQSMPAEVAAMMDDSTRHAAIAAGQSLDPRIKAEIDELWRIAYARADAGPVVSAPEVDDSELAFIPLTDLGNAERFAARQKGRFLHVPEVGWYAYDGRRWSREGADDKAMRAAHATARAIQDEAKAIRGTDRDKVVSEPKGKEPVMLSDKVAAWGRSSEGSQKLVAILKHAAPYLAVTVSQLDADPWVLNVENGTIIIDRQAGDEDPIRFRPHDPADLITKLAPVHYDPAATCPRYNRFIKEVQPSPAMQRHLHQWGGYSLTGDTGEQKLCFWYGKGRNGKSTLIDTWGAVVGDYGETVPIETFLDQGRGRNAGSATPDLALLPAVRMLQTSEPEKNSKLAEALIKVLTGGEPIQARHLNRDYFKFRPAFKLTMSGNYRPQISGTDEGIWRRVVLVPWKVTVTNPDSRLFEALRAEASGILNRLLDGLRDYLENGLVLPAEVSDATQAYRDDSDPLGRFLEVATEISVGDRVSSSRLHSVFVAWAKASGEREWSPKGLSMAMKDRDFRLIRSDGSHWMDLRLLRDEADFAPPVPPDPRTPDR